MIEPVIHIVDDERLVRDSLAFMFTSLGQNVRTYASADEFLESYRDEAPGCLILDVRMPRKSGLQLQAELASRQIDLPVIVISGHADVAVAVRAMKLGAVNFIEKPFSHQTILDEVNASIEQHRSIWTTRRLQMDFHERMRSLTEREREVARLMVTGMSSKEIGRELQISNRTVEAHRSHVLAKFGVHSVFELAQRFRESGDEK